MGLADAEAVAKELVRRALAAGGRDNATAIVADLVQRDDPEDGWLDYLPFVRSAA
jgi:serine/threonine protein phosphatase PrpC